MKKWNMINGQVTDTNKVISTGQKITKIYDDEECNCSNKIDKLEKQIKELNNKLEAIILLDNGNLLSNNE
jgi:polyhydroxyalkanoate synthesis regulator phasin